MNAQRAMYDNDASLLQRDTTSMWATMQGASITASDFMFVGTANYTIVAAVSGATVGNVAIQINLSNPVTDSATGLKWTVNPLQGQPGMGSRKLYAVNSGFTGNWVTIGTLSAGTVQVATVTNTPTRYLRLFGLGLTAAGFRAYVWTDSMQQGT